MERPSPKEEGRQKSDGNGLGERQNGRGGGGGKIFNHGVYPQLRIIEDLGSTKMSARLENLRLTLGMVGRSTYVSSQRGNEIDPVRALMRLYVDTIGSW